MTLSTAYNSLQYMFNSPCLHSSIQLLINNVSPFVEMVMKLKG